METQPTEHVEDMEKAKRILEGTIEGAASQLREQLTEEDRGLLDKCDFTNASYYGNSLEGTIETGQKLKIEHYSAGAVPNEPMGGREDKFVGTLDGQRLTQEECQQYLDRYSRIAQYQRAASESENPDSHIFKSINK